MAAILLGTETETATLQVIRNTVSGQLEIYVDGPHEGDPATIITLTTYEERALRSELNLRT